MRNLTRRTVSVEPLELRITPANLVWTGDVNNLWDANNGGNTNWSNDALPQDGDTLLFPLIAQNRTNTNNMVGLDLVSISFGGTDYVISGQSITLSSGISDGSSAGANQFNVAIGLAADLVITVSVASSRLELGGALTGAFDLQKAGLGTLRYDGSTSNTYTGTTSVTAGTLELAKSGGVGGLTAVTGPLSIGDGIGAAGADVVRLIANNQVANSAAITVASTGRLDLNNLSELIGALTLQSGVTAPQVTTGTGTLTLNGDVTVTSGAAPIDITGKLNLGSATRIFDITNGAADPDLTISAVISGAGGLTKAGAGSLRLSGSEANTYTGTTTVTDGTLDLAKTGGVAAMAGPLIVGDAVGGLASAQVRVTADHNTTATTNLTVKTDGRFVLIGPTLTEIGAVAIEIGDVPAPSIDAATGTITIGGDVTLNATGAGNFGGSISGGTLNLGGVTRTFTIADGGALTDLVVSSVIANGGLTKAGPGAMSVSATNTYAGDTTISAGVLIALGPVSGSVLLNGGTLVGATTVGPLTSQAAGGTVAPGNFVGVLSSGAATFNAATIFDARLNGTANGTFDQLNVIGAVALGGAALQVSSGFTPGVGNTFVILNNDGADAIGGTFAGLPEGGLVATPEGFGFRISYVGGDGNDAVLTAVPAEVALAANGKTATFNEVDGDLVTIKTTRGAFDQSDFTLKFVPGPNGAGIQLQRINFSDDNGEFAGANLTITAKRGTSGGDSFVNVGAIDSTGSDLGVVIVSGDLGKISAGDTDAKKPGLASLTVQSLGLLGTSTQAAGGDLASAVNGPVGKLIVKSSVRDAFFSVVGGTAGNLGSVAIAGSLLGGTDGQSGSILAQGNIGAVKIGGDVRGGAGTTSGAIVAAGNLGAVQLRGSLIGGNGSGSGTFATLGGAIKSVAIGGSVIATSNLAVTAASIVAGTQLGPVKITGDISGTVSNPVIISGSGRAVAPAAGSDLAIQSLTVGGSAEFLVLRAGFSAAGGLGVNADASIGAVKIGGDFVSSVIVAGVDKGIDGLFGTLDDVKLIGGGVRDNTAIVSKIASVTVKGQILGSVGAGDAFGIVAEQIGALKVGLVKVPLTTGIDIIPIATTIDFIAREDVN